MKGTGLEARSVAHRFGRRWALRGVDLDVPAGSVTAVTGRNGSGKTTLLRICATLLRPTRGALTIFGLDLATDAARVREAVGLLAHDAGLYGNLTAEENLFFGLRMSGFAPDATLVRRTLAEVGLETERTERVRGFSAGMRRRLALARLMLRPPSLLLLDEPYASFDADGVELVNALATRTAERGGIALIATHDLVRAESIMHRRVHIVEGRLAQEVEPGQTPATATAAADGIE